MLASALETRAMIAEIPALTDSSKEWTACLYNFFRTMDKS
jgi:hypothetical protein